MNTKLALWMLAVSAVRVVLTGFLVVWFNRTSETIALRFATLCGVLLLFGLQLLFQLSPLEALRTE